MKRFLFIHLMCLIMPFLSYNNCNARQSEYGQTKEYGESAAKPTDAVSLIPQIDEPVELWIFVEDYRFITGKRIHFTLQMIWKLGVNVNMEEFNTADLSPFKIEKVTVGERQIFNNDCDYLIITYTLSLPDEAEEGKYTIPPFTISYTDEANKTTGQAGTSPITLKKVPILLDTKVDRDVVDIGDRIHYELTILHESYVKILKDNMEKLNFSPFHVINYEIEEGPEGKLKKTTMKYELSVYDIPDREGYLEIPSLPVLYYFDHEGEAEHKVEGELIVTQERKTPAIPVLINSLLKRIDVPLESIKGPVVYERKMICLRGHLPIIIGIVIIIILGAFEIRKYTSRLTKFVKEKIADEPLAHANKLKKLVTDLNPDAKADELRKSAIDIDCALRVFLSSLAETSREEVLSLATPRIIDMLKSKNLAGTIIESTNNALTAFDTMIFGGIDKEKIEKASNEVQEILKETKRRGFY